MRDARPWPLGSTRRLVAQLAAERPIVVMSRGHSGTRALVWALDMLGFRMGSRQAKPSRDVEHPAFKRMLIDLACRSVEASPDTAPAVRLQRRFQRQCRRYLRWLGRGPQGWGWKLPETYLLGPYVAATFPDARYIHMVRDGRDIAFKWHRSDRPDQRLGRRMLTHLGALDDPPHLRAGSSWAFQVDRFERFARTVPHQVHTLSFEALCTEPVATIERLCGFLEVPLNQRAREYLATEIRPSKVGQYRTEDPDLVAEVEERIGPTLRRLGYRCSLESSEESGVPA